MLTKHRVNSTLAIVILSFTAFTAGFLIIHVLKNAALSYNNSELILSETGS